MMLWEQSVSHAYNPTLVTNGVSHKVLMIYLMPLAIEAVNACCELPEQKHLIDNLVSHVANLVCGQSQLPQPMKSFQ